MPLATPTQTSPDPNDFTDRYNTPLPAGQQQAYATWAKQNGQDPEKGKYDYDLQGAFLSGAGRTSDTGHFPDTFKKPNHPTFSNESKYNGVDGYSGGQWTEAGYRPSATNFQFRSQQELQNYFANTEPDTKLLPPAPSPGKSGQMKSSTSFYRARPSQPNQTLAQPARKYYGQL